MGFLKHILILSFLTVGLSLSACKKDSEKFDLLASTGGGSAVEQLEITSTLPDQTAITLEVGQNQTFSITAVAPIPLTASYSWTFNGTPVAAVNQYSVTATLGNIGNHALIATATDGETSKSKQWDVKVNGAPVINPITTGVPKVSVGSILNIQATATDPNNDALTYTWLLNGLPSPFLVGTNGSAALTGDASFVGATAVTLQVSDGTATDSYTWNGETNHFPMACNTLTQGQICTYAGGAHKGSGLAHNNTQYPLRFRPFGHAQDALGNLFISDLDSHVVWYWNLTAGAVTRLGQNIPANTIQVIAGTGEATSGPVGVQSLTSGLNNPRGLWYNDATGTLYIAEYGGSRVKYVNNAGIVFVGMGTGPSHADGDTASNHDCDRPMQLAHYNNNIYISCYDDHRIKRWDLASDLAYVAAGDGGNDNAGENTNPALSGVGRPYGLYVDVNGIYIGSWTNHKVRFVNHTAAPITFWSGNPDQVIVAAGNIATIIGDGGSGETPTSGNPLSIDMGRPAAITVRNGNEIYIAGQQSDNIVFANNSGGNITIDGLTINSGTVGRITSSTGGYNGSNAGVTTRRVNDVYSLSIDVNDNNKMLFADYSNFRFREVDLSDGKVQHLAGSGRGSYGFYGDVELPTMQHLFIYPTGLRFDNTHRTLFFADQNNHRVRQVNAYGVLSTALGRGGGDPNIDNDIPSNVLLRTNFSGTNSLNNAFDIWSDGTLAQLNSYGHNVRLWNRSGSDKTYMGVFVQNDRISTVAGDWASGAGTGADGPALNTQLRYPNAVRFYDNAGSMEMFILDTMNHCVRHVDGAGNLTTVLGLCGTSGDPGNDVATASARFNRPRGLALDEFGNLFISDMNNHHIWYWNRGGVARTIGAITVNPGRISVVSCISGTGGSNSENVFTSSSRCNQPLGLAYRDGKLCYAQRNRHNVRCFNRTDGLVNTIAGRPEASPRAGRVFDFSQEGISATSATLYYPSSVAFDDNGDLYISDTYNHIVRKVKLSP